MPAKSQRGYVLKVAVASAALGCASLTGCEGQHAVGTVAQPPRPDTDPSASAQQPVAVGAVAQTPDARDAAAVPPAPSASAPPKPTIKVGILAEPPDALTVGTTAHAPDAKPPARKK